MQAHGWKKNGIKTFPLLRMEAWCLSWQPLAGCTRTNARYGTERVAGEESPLCAAAEPTDTSETLLDSPIESPKDGAATARTIFILILAAIVGGIPVSWIQIPFGLVIFITIVGSAHEAALTIAIRVTVAVVMFQRTPAAIVPSSAPAWLKPHRKAQVSEKSSRAATPFAFIPADRNGCTRL